MIWKRLRLTLDMIKFEHSVFALPFALTGALLAFREGGYDWTGRGTHAAVDRGGDGGGAVGGDGLQPAGGRGHRRAQSANQHAAPAGRNAEPRVRLGVRGGRLRDFRAGGVAVESAMPAFGSGGAGDRVLLFLHQALHLVFAPGVGIQPGDRAGRRVDRGAGIAGSAHPVAHCGCDVLDRRFRRDLFVPGLRIRPRRGVVERAQAVGNRGSAAGGAGVPRR